MAAGHATFGYERLSKKATIREKLWWRGKWDASASAAASTSASVSATATATANYDYTTMRPAVGQVTGKLSDTSKSSLRSAPMLSGTRACASPPSG